MPEKGCVMVILIDTREQAPFLFNGKRTPGVTTIFQGLPTGDYSLPGFEDRISAERKSLDDLIGCLMGDNRDRFERELWRGKSYDVFAVVVEASMDDIGHHRYTSRMKPHAVLQSLAAFQVRYRVPFIFAGGRAWAEYWIYSMLQKYLEEINCRMRTARLGQDLAI